MTMRNWSILIVFGLVLASVIWLATSDRADQSTRSTADDNRNLTVAEIVQSLPGSDQRNSEAPENAGALDARREFIRQYRVDGAEFILEQRDYIDAIADRETRLKLDVNFTTANRIWLGAIIAEMARDPDYRDAVAGLMNDGQFRRYAIDNLEDLMPDLVDYLKTGKRVSPGDAEKLLEDVRDFQSEFDELRPDLPEEIASRFESEIGSMIAGDVLHWQFLTDNPEAAGESAFVFFWGGRTPDPIE